MQNNLNRAAMGMGAVDHEVALPGGGGAGGGGGSGGGGNGGGGPVPEGSAEIYRVAQSGDATCNGLFSPMEGSRTMTLRKGECFDELDPIFLV